MDIKNTRYEVQNQDLSEEEAYVIGEFEVKIPTLVEMEESEHDMAKSL